MGSQHTQILLQISKTVIELKEVVRYFTSHWEDPISSLGNPDSHSSIRVVIDSKGKKYNFA